jgi:SNF2 family DNA or RNA helicase
MPQLYPFQQESIDKFIDVPAALNGDDMGLGKTVQGIALDLAKREKFGPRFKGRPMTLVVTRTSVMGVWERHYNEWAPHLKTMVIDRKNRGAFATSFLNHECDVYIVHWAAIRLLPELHRVKWFHVIGDEIHAIKNRKAQQSQAFKKIQTVFKYGLSGTAADNRPDDIWSVLNWLYPRTWNGYKKFYDTHINYQEVVNEFTGRRYKKILGVVNAESFLKSIKRIYIRRLKEEVLDDLPEKYYSTIYCDLDYTQRKAYDMMAHAMMAWVGEHEDEPIAAPVVITQLTRLQQFAVAYGALDTKIVRKRICETCTDEGHEKCQGHEQQVLKLIEPSSKLDVVMQIVEDNPGKPLVVWAQSKQVINMLVKRLQAAGIEPAVLTGDTPSDVRDKLVEDFQRGHYTIFVGTIKAGGEGITLTAADTEIFIDRDWSPSKNRQTEDRLHRIGQKNAVHIIDIVARNTIDLGRHSQIKQKWVWIRQMLGDIDSVRAELELENAKVPRQRTPVD